MRSKGFIPVLDKFSHLVVSICSKKFMLLTVLITAGTTGSSQWCLDSFMGFAGLRTKTVRALWHAFGVGFHFATANLLLQRFYGTDFSTGPVGKCGQGTADPLHKHLHSALPQRRYCTPAAKIASV